MNPALQRSLAILISLAGTACLLPMAAAGWYGEHGCLLGFGIPLAFCWLIALVVGLRMHGKIGSVVGGNVFVFVGSAWTILIALGAVPLAVCGHYGVVDALFESFSGFTTTGTTVATDVEALPHCVNLWRCLMQWLGGMGFVGLVVALLPMLGMRNFRAVQAEETGPEKDRLTSRIKDTAQLLWLIYTMLTAVQCVLLHACGMGWFDALCHAFSTLGTGGFSTRNGSIAAFASSSIEWITIAFMFLGAVNFGVLFLMATGRWREVLRNNELRAFLFLIVTVSTAVALIGYGDFGSLAASVRHSVFQAVSLVSTTGFISCDYTTWRPAAQLLLLFLFLIGGCSGSTAGGVKVIRWVMLAREFHRDILQMIHPHGVFTLRINGRPVESQLAARVGSFIYVYFAIVFVTAFCGTLFGQDIHTAFTTALAMVGNVGTAFGSFGPTANAGDLPNVLKLVYCVAMLAGRLEVYTLLILVGQSLTRKHWLGAAPPPRVAQP